jgi:hypothetical protein
MYLPTLVEGPFGCSKDLEAAAWNCFFYMSHVIYRYSNQS